MKTKIMKHSFTNSLYQFGLAACCMVLFAIDVYAIQIQVERDTNVYDGANIIGVVSAGERHEVLNEVERYFLIPFEAGNNSRGWVRKDDVSVVETEDLLPEGYRVLSLDTKPWQVPVDTLVIPEQDILIPARTRKVLIQGWDTQSQGYIDADFNDLEVSLYAYESSSRDRILPAGTHLRVLGITLESSDDVEEFLSTYIWLETSSGVSFYLEHHCAYRFAYCSGSTITRFTHNIRSISLGFFAPLPDIIE